MSTHGDFKDDDKKGCMIWRTDFNATTTDAKTV